MNNKQDTISDLDTIRVKLYRTYSDENKYIRKVGTDEVYSEAVDIEGVNYQYEETEIEIEIEETETVIETFNDEQVSHP